MIIQLRGTSGSGKTTAMKRVMDLMGDWQAVSSLGRKQPLYYHTAEGSDWPLTVVLGHYNTACGGCDTVGSAKAVYELIQRVLKAEPAAHVLCEGLLLSEDVKWTSHLYQDGHDLRVMYLTTETEQCLRNVAARRKAAGNDEPVNPKNTVNRVGTIERSREKLEAAGVVCRAVSPRQAPDAIIQLLRLHAQ